MEREQATKFIYDLLRALIAKKGSDLFITAGFPPAMKIDSKMTPVSQQALTQQHTAMLVLDHERQASGGIRSDRECNFATPRRASAASASTASSRWVSARCCG
jgi:twitching motility protein PilU